MLLLFCFLGLHGARFRGHAANLGLDQPRARRRRSKKQSLRVPHLAFDQSELKVGRECSTKQSGKFRKKFRDRRNTGTKLEKHANHSCKTVCKTAGRQHRPRWRSRSTWWGRKQTGRWCLHWHGERRSGSAGHYK